jgi:hypothetical protein
LFGEWELAERKRIWFGCVILDKYISAYIGRPLMILDSDFDTMLPSVTDLEENEEWSVEKLLGERSTPVPGRVISCFNASANLSGILGKIIQSVYAIRPNTSRQAESAILESMLDKWYLDLPDHLRCEISAGGVPSSSAVPPPNVLTLHMQYWCTVLLLHRPFITHLLHKKGKPLDEEEPEARARIAKSYELCHAAANHIASLVALYQEKYLLERCPVFLCYYVFTASIMHDNHVSLHSDDPQGRAGFLKCYNSLRAMRVVWPGAGRAFDLFFGAKSREADRKRDMAAPTLVELTRPGMTKDKNKRGAEAFDDNNVATLPTPLPQIPRVAPYEPSSRRHSISTRTPSYSQPPSSQQNNGVPNPPPIFTSGYVQGPLASPASPAYTPILSSSANYWPGMGGYSDPLSTAVIPQLYSSGLADDINPHIRGMQTQPGSHQPHHQHSSSQGTQYGRV